MAGLLYKVALCCCAGHTIGFIGHTKLNKPRHYANFSIGDATLNSDGMKHKASGHLESAAVNDPFSTNHKTSKNTKPKVDKDPPPRSGYEADEIITPPNDSQIPTVGTKTIIQDESEWDPETLLAQLKARDERIKAQEEENKTLLAQLKPRDERIKAQEEENKALREENEKLKAQDEKNKESTEASLTEGKNITLEVLGNIKPNKSWQDCSNQMEFAGRHDFAQAIQNTLEGGLLKTCPNGKNATTLVYSSVSGTGKTVSMLQLKAKLPKQIDGHPVIVAHLGFNSGIELTSAEDSGITDSSNARIFSKKVLARRLAVMTIVSMNNPEVITTIPRKLIFDGFRIPPVEESKELLLNYLKQETKLPVYIVAGVDEVQKLNMDVPNVAGVGLGRFFLRVLREWQSEWHNDGIRLLPLGTGIALDWSTDPTDGEVKALWGLSKKYALRGDDTTLISKHDFRDLVTKVVDSLSDEEFVTRFSSSTSKTTVVDLISALFWPRVRLLEWWRDNKSIDVVTDNNSAQWVTWLSYWLCDEPISVLRKDLLPGKDHPLGAIRCLFESITAEEFSVIPDGYCANSMIEQLKEKFPSATRLYAELRVSSLDPKEFILKDAHKFEDFGFHVVGASIHMGIYALKEIGPEISPSSATQVQNKRLGLAMWFWEQKAETGVGGMLKDPELLGAIASTDKASSANYPFTNSTQNKFVQELVDILRERKPVYIRCGMKTCCDYLYIYPAKPNSFVCLICDAKHTSMDENSREENIKSSEQTKLYNALSNVHTAFTDAGLALGATRLVFVTNKNGLAKNDKQPSAQLASAKANAKALFPNVTLELLNKHNFEFGPFSDTLMARWKPDAKTD